MRKPDVIVLVKRDKFLNRNASKHFYVIGKNNTMVYEDSDLFDRILEERIKSK